MFSHNLNFDNESESVSRVKESNLLKKNQCFFFILGESKGKIMRERGERGILLLLKHYKMTLAKEWNLIFT